jgi:hypothetical protein
VVDRNQQVRAHGRGRAIRQDSAFGKYPDGKAVLLQGFAHVGGERAVELELRAAARRDRAGRRGMVTDVERDEERRSGASDRI